MLVACFLLPRNAAVGLDHIEKPAHMRQWVEFHNGVAAGLRIAPGISKVGQSPLPFPPLPFPPPSPPPPPSSSSSPLHPSTSPHFSPPLPPPPFTPHSLRTHMYALPSQLDSTWIIFNHPSEENSSNTYAGFLMALGLHGHLASLSDYHLYDYLQEKHELTVVGLLLGISAARLTILPSPPSLTPLHFPSG